MRYKPNEKKKPIKKKKKKKRKRIEKRVASCLKTTATKIKIH